MVHKLTCVMAIVTGLAARAQQSIVVPLAHATQDAPSRCWVAGAYKDLRQQTLIGASHLTSLVGHSLTAITFRRNAKPEAFAAGTANMTVALSVTTRSPNDCAATFADNIGSGATVVFQGPVAIPFSPPATGPAIAWSPENTIRIVFTQPFLYSGGTLCLDITGTVTQGQLASGWAADAAYDLAAGIAVDIGSGCGPFANQHGQWSFVDPHSLLPGSVARMDAYGTPGDFALAIIGAPGAAFPLADVGLGQVGCNAYLSSIEMMWITQFAAVPLEVAARGGVARWRPGIPNQSWVLGLQLTTQWLDLSSLHSSNAVLWTVAAQSAVLDMALVDGAALDVAGTVTPYLAHVLRFDYQ